MKYKKDDVVVIKSTKTIGKIVDVIEIHYIIFHIKLK